MAKQHIFIRERLQMQAHFFDVDSVNVVWHGNYVKYFEIARCNLLDKIGYGYNQMRADGFGYPVAKFECKYLAPIRFADIFEVEACLTEYESSLQFLYFIFDRRGRKITRASSMQVCIRLDTFESCFSTSEKLQTVVKNYSGYIPKEE